uniref:Uncharacterized protein n=1 Tax=Arundo donax TaxID=35708 RepID=A0A0A9GI36_ARUDO
MRGSVLFSSACSVLSLCSVPSFLPVTGHTPLLFLSDFIEHSPLLFLSDFTGHTPPPVVALAKGQRELMILYSIVPWIQGACVHRRAAAARRAPPCGLPTRHRPRPLATTLARSPAAAGVAAAPRCVVSLARRAHDHEDLDGERLVADGSARS